MGQRGSWHEVVQSRYWREGDARQVVAAWRRSGKGRGEFCRAQGISLDRLSRWIARLERGAAVPFHPVRVTGIARSAEGLVIELPGVATIRLPAGFALEDLRRVLSAFEAEAC